jgi:glutamyl-tRNA synthetase
VKTLVEMADLSEFYFRKDITYDEKAVEKFLKAETVPLFEQIIHALSKEEILDKGSCHRLIQQLAEERGEPLVKIAQPIRVALTGKTVSPPIDEVLEVLGKSMVIQRLQKAIEFIEHKKL